MIHSVRDLKLSVHFYRSGSGNEPVLDWLRGLSKAERKAIGEDIKAVQLGWPLGMPVVRKLEAGLWEIRTHLPNAWARVLFTVTGQTVVLLHGFLKASRKTPRHELMTARKRLVEVHEKK